MANYNDSKIYKITSSKTDKIYIGVTTKSLETRMKQHLQHYERFIKNDLPTDFISSFQVIKNGDAKIELIEMFPCKSKFELEDREKYLINHTENCVNLINNFRNRVTSAESAIVSAISILDETPKQVKGTMNKRLNLIKQLQDLVNVKDLYEFDIVATLRTADKDELSKMVKIPFYKEIVSAFQLRTSKFSETMSLKQAYRLLNDLCYRPFRSIMEIARVSTKAVDMKFKRFITNRRDEFDQIYSPNR
jgi:predicted GIY-YIG superfamily endonuclease